MPNYGKHKSWGKRSALIIYAIISFVLLELFQVGPIRILAFGVGFVPVAFVFSTVPDLDHKDSIPRRIFGKLSWYLAPVVAAVIVLINNPIRELLIKRVADMAVNKTSVPVESVLVVELVIANILVGSLVFGMLYTLDKVLTHRGVLHNPATAFVLSGIAVCFTYIYIGNVVPWMMLGGIGSGSVLGYLTHLRLDEELDLWG